MKDYLDAFDRNIIKILDGEEEYFDKLVKKNNIKWFSEDRKIGVLNLSKAYVGYIVTPNRKINLLPKYKEINFEHIFRMYLYVYGYKSTDNSAVLDIADSQNEIDVAKLFLNSLKKDIHLGIIQSYQNNLTNSRILKGKVHFPKTYMNYSLGKKDYVTSHVYELTLNNTFNQLIATALTKLRHVKKHSSEAKSLLMYFEGVKNNVNNASTLLESINFTSNTARYRQTLIYASMIIDQLDYDDIGDSIGTESFLINFDRLFEDFVAKILISIPEKREFNKWKSGKKFADIISNGIIQGEREYLPDLLYKYIEEDPNHDYLPSSYAILDVKNKAYGIFKNADVYQMLMYAKILHSKKALLLYPSFIRKKPESLVMNPEIFNPAVITSCYINIADSSGDEFLASIIHFVDTVEKVLLDIEAYIE